MIHSLPMNPGEAYVVYGGGVVCMNDTCTDYVQYDQNQSRDTRSQFVHGQ